eukprot:GHVU01051256.1.p1 GENE.GHVU01051256.1~~GHVU01051256.1.p1  ORF type:complete len:379 (+),score=38.04 GHVU01051256.1:112-1248(+)
MAEALNGFILPIDIVRATPFSLDFGCTVAKLVYRAKEDQQHNSDQNQTKGKLRVASFSPSETLGDELVKFIQDHCDLDSFGKQDTATASGVQSGGVEAAITKAFGIKFKYIHEMQAFTDAIVHLSKSGLKPEEVFDPLPEDGIKNGNSLTTIYNNMTKDYVKGIGMDCKDTPHETMLPCIIAMLGSGTCFLEAHEDTTIPEMTDGSFKGGRTFLGLSSLLTGEKDFNKLVEMSCRGNRHKIDMSISDFAPPSNESNPYDRSNNPDAPPDVSIHIMGKASTKPKDEINPDDVMDSLFSMWAVDIAQTSHLVALARHIPRVYFVGSFVNNEKVRRYITREFTMRNGIFSHGRECVKFEFLRHGGHIGALGAFVNNYKQDS